MRTFIVNLITLSIFSVSTIALAWDKPTQDKLQSMDTKALKSIAYTYAAEVQHRRGNLVDLEIPADVNLDLDDLSVNELKKQTMFYFKEVQRRQIILSNIAVRYTNVVWSNFTQAMVGVILFKHGYWERRHAIKNNKQARQKFTIFVKSSVIRVQQDLISQMSE